MNSRKEGNSLPSHPDVERAVIQARNEASRRAAPLVAKVDRLFFEYYGEGDGFPPPDRPAQSTRGRH